MLNLTYSQGQKLLDCLPSFSSIQPFTALKLCQLSIMRWNGYLKPFSQYRIFPFPSIVLLCLTVKSMPNLMLVNIEIGERRTFFSFYYCIFFQKINENMKLYKVVVRLKGCLTHQIVFFFKEEESIQCIWSLKLLRQIHISHIFCETPKKIAHTCYCNQTPLLCTFPSIGKTILNKLT